MASMPAWMRRAAERARDELVRLDMSRRVLHGTGLLAELTPAGAMALVRARGKLHPALAIRYHAANTPHRTALVAEAGGEVRRYSYFEVDDIVARLTAGLRRLGLGEGEAVALMLDNVPEMILLQHAVSRLGGAAVSASWRSTTAELAQLLDGSEARALFFSPRAAEAVAGLTGAARARLGERVFGVGEAQGERHYRELLDARPEESEPGASERSTVVIFTSGTTGRPKGAVRAFGRASHLAIASFIAETPLCSGQTHLACCPLYHSTGYAFTNLALALGGTVVLLERFEPAAFLSALERHQVHHTAVIPTMLYRTLELGLDAIRARDTSSLQAIFCGGAPLSPALATATLEAFGDKLFNFYGATETGIVTLAKPADLRLAPGTVGRCIEGNRIRLLDERGLDVPEGSPGELYVKSGNLIAGYRNDEGATRESMRDGYFSVGDVARRDARGYYFLEGRKRDMIISGGVNIYPSEIESALAEHPAVLEGAVVGVPDAEWGERVHAFVELRAGASAQEEEIFAFCRARLAGPKRPRGISIVAELPRNPTGKVLKGELRQRLLR